VTLVSVCIPTRNQGRFLRAAVESALSQEVDGLEVLVHDDASDDSTDAVLSTFTDSRIRIVRHAVPRGIAANRNSCLAEARGRYIAWLDSDDLFLPGSLARRLAVLDSNPNVGLVHGAFELIDANDRPLRAWPASYTSDAIQPRQSAFRDLIASNAITTSTVVVRRSIQDDAGTFSTSIGGSSTDWDMWLRIALRGDVAYTPTPVARYRQHAQTISHSATKSGERLRCDVRVAERVLHDERRRIREPREAARIARASLAAKALAHAGDLYTAGRRRDAVRAVLLAARLAPRTAGPGAIRLLAATARGDDYACYRWSRQLLSTLADQLEPRTRHGCRLRAAASTDTLYEQMLVRVAQRVRRLTPPDAHLATVTKWDPTLLWLSHRRGIQFPDRRQMPDGYPQDADAVIAHLEYLRSRGVTHLVFTSATTWWLEHYSEFGKHLACSYDVLHRDDDCVIYDLRT
jgi:GT2 family glycosyltransferase